MPAVTVERLERALALCAYFIELDGPVAAPLFERLERELAALRASDSTVARAKALLESYRRPRKDAAPWSPATDPPASNVVDIKDHMDATYYTDAGGLKAIR